MRTKDQGPNFNHPKRGRIANYYKLVDWLTEFLIVLWLSLLEMDE